MPQGADTTEPTPGEDLLSKVAERYSTILADPPWQFQNRTGKMAPEHKRLLRYPTMGIQEIMDLPIAAVAAERSHLYLWIPNALLNEGLRVMAAWGFTYKSNLIWYKVRKDGGPDGRGVGFYFRNVTEMILFGVRGGMRTLAPGRRQVNLLSTQKREHSRKPDEIFDIIEQCSPGPYLELFARFQRDGWDQWGNEDVERNSFHGVALRTGHTQGHLGLPEASAAYRGKASD
ncbi:MT-A70 family methyltransferase [uncultured Thiodictyon sp.]|uniref:MT-A70 family methyltransferase n=1 Tax=uncultured Thiodictyon sp. TaxID=1846217 RepID=UPI0025EF9698|nr:MT-A70 family methyltransferase [uncultured Thiodictyon sp.]